MIFFTADTHFFHANIIRYCDRPFSNLDHMHETLVYNWNQAVGHKDVVYVLGDFSLGSVEQTIEVTAKLNGKIYLVPGDHDYFVQKFDWNSYGMLSASNEYLEVLPMVYQLQIPVPGSKYPETWVLCHWAMAVWPLAHYNSYHLFGHSHGHYVQEGRALDCGVDSGGAGLKRFVPNSIDAYREWLQEFNNPNKLKKLFLDN